MSCFCIDEGQSIKTFTDVECYLNSIGLFHMDMGLERMERAIRLLNLKLPCPVVQVVGTNGKGSTASFLHSIALSNGFRAGIFTSPHFVSPVERIRMNDRLLPQKAWATFTNQALSAVPDLTYFELLTVISMLAYAFAEPDLIIYEAGLGAKHDATSAIPADIVCITPIAFDHQTYLGNTLEEIATEKSHAIRPHVSAVVSATQEESVWKILQKRAKQENIPLVHMGDMDILSKDILSDQLREKIIKAPKKLALKGEHQETNAQVAVMAWHLLCKKQGWHFETNAVLAGLSDAFIAGRFQEVKAKNDTPPLILDGAHNEHSMKSLLKTLEFENISPSAFIFSCLEDKNPQKLVNLLEEYFLKNELQIPVILLPIAENERAVQPQILQSYFTQETHICNTMKEALNLSTQINQKNKSLTQPVVVCGSLYLLAQYYQLYPNALQTSF